MSKTVAILITFFLGALGVHRFITGKLLTGVLWLLTGGCFGIGWIVDLIMVITGSYKDHDGDHWPKTDDDSIDEPWPKQS